MPEAEDRLDAALKIIEDYPNLHMGPTVSFVLGAVQQPIGAVPEDEQAGRDKLRRLLTTLRMRRQAAAFESNGAEISERTWRRACHSSTVWLGKFSPAIRTILRSWLMRCGSCTARRSWPGSTLIDDYVWHRFTPDEIRTIEELLDECAD